jgi:hypothetical protein
MNVAWNRAKTAAVTTRRLPRDEFSTHARPDHNRSGLRAVSGRDVNQHFAEKAKIVRTSLQIQVVLRVFTPSRRIFHTEIVGFRSFSADFHPESLRLRTDF